MKKLLTILAAAVFASTTALSAAPAIADELILLPPLEDTASEPQQKVKKSKKTKKSVKAKKTRVKTVKKAPRKPRR